MKPRPVRRPPQRQRGLICYEMGEIAALALDKIEAEHGIEYEFSPEEYETAKLTVALELVARWQRTFN